MELIILFDHISSIIGPSRILTTIKKSLEVTKYTTKKKSLDFTSSLCLVEVFTQGFVSINSKRNKVETITMHAWPQDPHSLHREYTAKYCVISRIAYIQDTMSDIYGDP